MKGHTFNTNFHYNLLVLFMQHCSSAYWKHGARQKLKNLDAEKTMYEQLKVRILHAGNEVML